MKILVTGVAGQLGHDMMEELHKRGHEPIVSDIVPNVDFETSAQMGKSNIVENLG